MNLFWVKSEFFEYFQVKKFSGVLILKIPLKILKSYIYFGCGSCCFRNSHQEERKNVEIWRFGRQKEFIWTWIRRFENEPKQHSKTWRSEHVRHGLFESEMWFLGARDRAFQKMTRVRYLFVKPIGISCAFAQDARQSGAAPQHVFFSYSNEEFSIFQNFA